MAAQHGTRSVLLCSSLRMKSTQSELIIGRPLLRQVSHVVEAAKKIAPVKQAKKAVSKATKVVKKAAPKAKKAVSGGGASFWYGPDRPGFLGKDPILLHLVCCFHSGIACVGLFTEDGFERMCKGFLMVMCRPLHRRALIP